MLSRKERSGRRGSAAVEMALILPVLGMLTLPVMDYCWYFMCYQSVLSSAQMGTRDGARAEVYEDPVVLAVETAESSVETSLPWLADDTTYAAQILNSDTIELQVTSTFVPLTNFLEMPTTVSAVYRMRLEHP